MEASPNQYTEPVKRIDGIKYHVAQLSTEELEGIRGHLTVKHCQIVGEIAFIDEVILQRSLVQLPMEQPYEV